MDYYILFTSASGMIVLINTITEYCKIQFKINTKWVQYFSWCVGILLSIFGHYLNIGMFMDTTLIQAIMLGFITSLSSNGTFDTGLVDFIVSKFKINNK